MFDEKVLGWFSNRTGKSVDDGARKSNNWVDQWKSGKLGAESRVLSFPRTFPSSNDVRALLLNQPPDKLATGVFAIEAKKFHLLLHSIYLSEQFYPFKISNDA